MGVGELAGAVAAAGGGTGRTCRAATSPGPAIESAGGAALRVGAPGTVAGIAASAFEAGLSPTAFVALTLNV